MMTYFDQILSQAYQRNPILSALIGVYLDGGRIVCTGDLVESIFNLAPQLPFEKVSNLLDARLLQSSSRDIIFCEQVSVDQLWELSLRTSAQLVFFSDKVVDETLVDYHCNEQSLRSALMEISVVFSDIEKQKLSSSILNGALSNKALFLDRDGVVVEDVDYLSEVSDVKLKADAVRLIRRARDQKYFVFIVTNQSGLGRGMYSLEQYNQVTARMLSLLVAEGLYVDHVYKSPFFEKSLLSMGLIRKSLRKPRPAMLLTARDEWNLNLSDCQLVGDTATDLMAGASAGLKSVYLLQSHRTTVELPKWKRWPLLSRSVAKTKMQLISSMDEIHF